MAGNITTGRLALAGVSVLLLVSGAVVWFMTSGDDATTVLAADAYGDQKVGAVDPNVSMSTKWSKDHAWQANVDYARGTGTIEVDLRNSDAEHHDRMKVHANFKPAPAGHVGANWLTRGPDGIFRSTEVDLPKGQYTLGLTGYEKYRFTFRIEKTLVVE